MDNTGSRIYWVDKRTCRLRSSIVMFVDVWGSCTVDGYTVPVDDVCTSKHCGLQKLYELIADRVLEANSLLII